MSKEDMEFLGALSEVIGPTLSEEEMDKPMAEVFDETDKSHAITYALRTRGLRSKTLRKLVKLIVRLRWEAEKKGEVWQKVNERSPTHLDANDLMSAVKAEDVQEVLDVSERTAHDYCKVVNYVAYFV